VNIDQLLDSLAENDPNEFGVLAQVARKRRAARQRLYAASGGLAVVAAAIAAILILPGIHFGSPTASTSSSTAAGAAGPVPAGVAPAASGSGSSSGNSGSAASCAGVPLRQDIANALRSGASVVVGYATQTGTSQAGDPAAGGAPAYYAVTLRSVQTLAGPAIASGSAAWVPGAASGAAASGAGAYGATSSGGALSAPEGEVLWAPGGELFAIVSPHADGAPRGPVLRSAPIINGKVIFSSYGCWNPAGLPGSTYSGGTAQVLGPVHPNGSQERPLALSGESLYAVPLAAVEKVATGH
jgi:hypothetical protein